MFKNILVPIDITHTQSIEHAINAGTKLSDTSGAKMTLMTVIADAPNLVAAQLPPNYAEEAASAAAEQLKAIAGSAGLDEGSVDIVVKDGSAYHEILEQAQAMSADLIVVASHRPELSDYLLGTVAARVVRHANCSVLVLRK